MKVKKNKGFSLIELMVAIAILGIALAIAAPSYIRYSQNTNLRETTEEFTSIIAFCRQRAMAENVRYRVLLAIAGNQYSVEKSVNPDNLDTYIALVPSVVKSFAEHSPQVSMTAGPVSIIAHPRGTLSADTTILQHAGTARTATITTHLSGRVNVQYQDAG